MPISIVVGGQYGSEGKGKVALEMVRRDPSIRMVVRPGGTNSGHTGYSADGTRHVLRQLPAAAIDGEVTVIFPAGSYIDLDILGAEMVALNIAPARVRIDPRANIIRKEHVAWEEGSGLSGRIGSTASGTGAAVLARLGRGAVDIPIPVEARFAPQLRSMVADVTGLMAEVLQAGNRVLIEGTQGFGLSPLHGDHWPKATSRDTTAASLLGEAGLSPAFVDEIVLVIRTYPIRVSGPSGPLEKETNWSHVSAKSGGRSDLTEYTSVTNKIRRIGFFENEIVQRAALVNSPTAVSLNHLDYIDATIWEQRRLSRKAIDFIDFVESSTGVPIDMVGTGPTTLMPLRQRAGSLLAHG